MTWQEEVELQADLAAEKARKEALEENKIETAKKMLEDNLSPQSVSKYTSLPLEKVLELQKQFQTVKA